jgi:hypothetical protein
MQSEMNRAALINQDELHYWDAEVQQRLMSDRTANPKGRRKFGFTASKEI